MTRIQFRNATSADRDSLNRIKRAASLVSDEYREALLAHPEFLLVPDEQIESGQVVVAEAGGEIVGLAAISRRDDGLELEGLFVDPSRWKQGIGRRLIEVAVRQHSEGPALTPLHVIASPDAKPFYLACGFKIVGDTDTRFGPAIVMRLDR
ncbi:GNAT family N-acetyltransferase [Devosia sp. ZW T5_3]|uniref:GNAT family N-acetyltransferase n=1 Tax=Devosia sp. ZW T5_3 TaxID=3378085 RepID=UPI003854FF8D